MFSERIAKPGQSLRWYQFSPGRLLLLLLIVEGILFLSASWFSKGFAVLLSIAAVMLTIVVMLLWFALAMLFRWQFQVSTRSLLVLPIAAAISFGWLAVEMKRAKRQKEGVGVFLKMGGEVGYDDFNAPRAWLTGAKQPVPAWLRETLGDDFFRDVNLVFVRGLNATDAEVEYVQAMNLESLYLDHTKISDTGISQLTHLHRLRILGLADTNISDVGLKYLVGLTRLEFLALSDTKITDKGLESLQDLTNLKKLELEKTTVTNAGVAKLQKALPNCEIER